MGDSKCFDINAAQKTGEEGSGRQSMRNVIAKPTDLAALILEEYIKPGDCVLDATAGNGHDTLLLAKLVGTEGKVYAFDIQMEALLQTEKLLLENGVESVMYDPSCAAPLGCNGLLGPSAGGPADETGTDPVNCVGKKCGNPVRLICDSHENVKTYIKEELVGAVFNLGYLPGGDKSVVTDGASSCRALLAALDLLAKRGIVVVTVYSGHPEGCREKEMLLSMLAELPQKQYHVAYTSLINQKGNPPEVVAVWKK